MEKLTKTNSKGFELKVATFVVVVTSNASRTCGRTSLIQGCRILCHYSEVCCTWTCESVRISSGPLQNSVP